MIEALKAIDGVKEATIERVGLAISVLIDFEQNYTVLTLANTEKVRLIKNNIANIMYDLQQVGTIYRSKTDTGYRAESVSVRIGTTDLYKNIRFASSVAIDIYPFVFIKVCTV